MSFLFFFSLIPSISVHASMYPNPMMQTSMAQTSQNTETKVSVTEEDLDWLDTFVEIKEEDLKKKLDTMTVVSASVNQSSGTLYLILSKDEEQTDLSYYKITDASYSFQVYLRICGIDIQSLAFNETDGDKQKKSSIFSSSFFWLILLMMISSCLPFFFLYRMKKKVTVGEKAGADDKSKEKVPSVKFSDVEGIEELKADITRLVDCLKNPKKYQQIGAKPPKGVILYGPPGTGKTLIAKAIAGEAGVPFFSEVGSNFVEMYVGVGAKRVRELYKKARKAAPCIVFIDEIDAVAGKRGNDNNSERDQTINALLAELDGFDSSTGIITICATNRLDMLDSAFKRAGRFDLKLAVGLPDKKSRKHILQIHGKSKKFMDDVDMDAIATKTSGFSGAELEALLNESALIAVGKKKQAIGSEDIEDAFFKIVMQGNKKKREEVTELNRIVAWHESGHTLATKLLTDDSVTSVTIVGSSSGAGGVTFRTPKDENMLQSKQYLENSIKVMYAGRAAEELYFGDPNQITTGASQDIKQATSVLKDYLASYGMGEKGMLDLTQFERDSKSILDEASALSKQLYTETLMLFREHYDLLKELAETLLQEETLDEGQVDAIIQAA